VEDFVAAAMREDSRAAEHDFGSTEEARELVRKTFAFLKRHISEGEMKDLIADLPEHLKTFVEEA